MEASSITMFIGLLILAAYGGAVAMLLKDAVQDKNYWAWFQLFLGVFLTFNAVGSVSLFAPTPVHFYGPLDRILSGLVVGGGFDFASTLFNRIYGLLTGKVQADAAKAGYDLLTSATMAQAPEPAPKWYQWFWVRIVFTGVAFLILTVLIQYLQGIGASTGFGPL